MLEKATFSEVELVLQLMKSVTLQMLPLFIGSTFDPKYLLDAKRKLAEMKAQNPLTPEQQAKVEEEVKKAMKQH